MNDHYYICQSLARLGYTTGWVVYGDTIDGITWVDENCPKPTNEELEAEIAKMKTEQA